MHPAQNTKNATPSWVRALRLCLLITFLLLVVKGIVAVGTSVYLSRPWRTNIVFNTNPVVIVSFPKEANEQILLVTLPATVAAPVPYGYGKYRLEAVSKLGELEKKPELLADTVENMLGVTIDGWMTTGAPVILSEKEPFEMLKKIQTTFAFMKLLNTTTNVSFVDKTLMLFRLSRATSSDLHFFATHTNDQLFYDTKLPDGTASKEINEALLEQFLEQKFEDSQIRRDGLTIKLFNTTQTPSLGKRFGRFVSQMGGKILTIGNQGSSESHCTVQASLENSEKRLVGYLQKEFECTLQIEEDLDADVVIQVGKTFAEKLSGY